MSHERGRKAKQVLGGLLAAGALASSPPAQAEFPPLGARVDSFNIVQERNAEAAKFVIYSHEFELNDAERPFSGWKLNDYGEDHVRRIAVQLKRGCVFPVVVERSQTSIRPGTEFRYPVHFDDALDEQRRKAIVASLEGLGVTNAENAVMVAPSFTEGMTATEAAQAYQRGLSGYGYGGYGGMGGGFGGGIGGFGGGFQ